MNMLDKIYCEDCMDTMKRMKKEKMTVDYIITSPPYNTVREGECYSNNNSLSTHMGRYDIYDEKLTDEEYIDWTIRLFNNFEEILSDNGVILYNLGYGAENTTLIWEVIYNILHQTRFTITDTIIWKKESALPVNTSPNKLTRICEYWFVICRKNEIDTFKTNKKVTTIREDSGQPYYENIYNYIEAPNNDGSCDLNKATYSTKLILDLLDIYVPNDSIVYDPFMGTGTTANACKQRGLHYIGSEISQAQCDYASERLSYKTLHEYFNI